MTLGFGNFGPDNECKENILDSELLRNSGKVDFSKKNSINIVQEKFDACAGDEGFGGKADPKLDSKSEEIFDKIGDSQKGPSHSEGGSDFEKLGKFLIAKIRDRL